MWARGVVNAAREASAWKLRFSNLPCAGASYSRRFFSVSLWENFMAHLNCRVVSFSGFRINFTKISIVPVLAMLTRWATSWAYIYNRYAHCEHGWIEKVLHFSRLTCFRLTSIVSILTLVPLLKYTLLNWDIFRWQLPRYKISRGCEQM